MIEKKRPNPPSVFAPLSPDPFGSFGSGRGACHPDLQSLSADDADIRK